MELRDIEYFSLVAEHKHLGRAAEALGLTQPALSKSLRRLEESLGAKLVKRTPKGVELTPEGAALARRMTELRIALTDVTREIADVRAGRAGHLRLGAAPGFIEDVVVPACARLVVELSTAMLTITAVTNDVLLPLLRNGELDLIVSGIPEAPFNDLVQEHLFDDEIVVIASRQHRLARRKKVTLADVSRERWAATTIDPDQWTAVRSHIDRLGAMTQRRIVIRTSYFPLRDRLIACTDLLGMSSKRYLRQIAPHLRLVELPVPELVQTRRVGITYRRNAYLAPLARRFIEVLKASAPADGR